MAADWTGRKPAGGLFPCPHCGGAGQGVFNDDGVPETCPSCAGSGHVAPPLSDDPTSEPGGPFAAPAHWPVILLGAGLGLALAMVALVGIVDSCEGGGAQAGQGAARLPQVARTLLQQRVLGQFVPVEFPPMAEDRVTDLPDGRYLVSSHVDVHDESVGAKVRRRYTMVLHRDGGGAWVMESATMAP